MAARSEQEHWFKPTRDHTVYMWKTERHDFGVARLEAVGRVLHKAEGSVSIAE